MYFIDDVRLGNLTQELSSERRGHCMGSPHQESSCPPTPAGDGLIAGDSQSENIHGGRGEVTEHDSPLEGSHDSQSAGNDDESGPKDVTRHEMRAQAAPSPERCSNTSLDERTPTILPQAPFGMRLSFFPHLLFILLGLSSSLLLQVMFLMLMLTLL